MLARYGMLRRRSRSMGPRSMAAYEDFNLRLDSRNLPACRRQRELRSAGGAPTRAARGAAAARVLRGYDDVQDGVAPDRTAHERRSQLDPRADRRWYVDDRRRIGHVHRLSGTRRA